MIVAHTVSVIRKSSKRFKQMDKIEVINNGISYSK